MKEPLEIVKQTLTYMAGKTPHYSERGELLRLLQNLVDTISASGHVLKLNADLNHYNYEELAKLDRKTQEAAYPLRR